MSKKKNNPPLTFASVFSESQGMRKDVLALVQGSRSFHGDGFVGNGSGANGAMMGNRSEGEEDKAMFFELREYRIKDGERERWVKLMEEKVIPFQVSKGMVFVASFVATEEPDL
jgi:hypothetical protein